MILVSVIIPTVNRPALLQEAIASALAQTHAEIEVIVVLNGATSETVEMAERFSADPKARVVAMEHATLAAARNFGMTFARGEWIAFLDDDDIWLPQKIEAQLAAAHESGADLVTCDYVHFDEHGDVAESGLGPRSDGLSYAEALMLENRLSGGSAAMVRASAIRALGGFDPQLKGCEDWDMWRRLSWDHKIYCIDQVLVKYRRHGTNMTRDHSRMLQAEARHFSKLLDDTPDKLRHMLPAAQRRYFLSVKVHLLAQGVRLKTSPAERMAESITAFIRVIFHAADKLSLGRAGAALHGENRDRSPPDIVRGR